MDSGLISEKFAPLYVRHAAASFDKQVYLRAMVGKAGWSFALEQGILAFRLPHETLPLVVQILGTESTEEQTWLWAWANRDSQIPTEALASANEMRALGQAQDIPELREGQVALSAYVNGGRLSALACGVCRAACYFRVAYPGGVLYMLIKDAHYKRSVRHPLQRIARIFPAFLTERDPLIADQRAAYLHYLAFYRLEVTVDDARPDHRRVVAALPVQARPAAGAFADAGTVDVGLGDVIPLAGRTVQLVATFDADNALVSLNESHDT